MLTETSTLKGLALDWAVCTALGHTGLYKADYGRLFKASDYGISKLGFKRLKPSTDWAQGGPIIDREGITVGPHTTSPFIAHYGSASVQTHWADRYTGPTYLVAAMRCFVANRIGLNVNVPDELLNEAPAHL